MVSGNAVFGSRYWGSAIYYSGNIVYSGGSKLLPPYTSVNEVIMSQDEGLTWTQLVANAQFSARSAHCMVVLTNGDIVLMGGGAYLNDVWRSTDGGTTWTRQTASAPWHGRYQFSATSYSGNIIIAGGWWQTGYPTGGALKDVWASYDAGSSWVQKASSPGWVPRFYNGLVALSDGSLVIVGGVGVDTWWNPINLSDVWISSDGGSNWVQQTASAPFGGRIPGGCVALDDDSIVMCGGYNGSILSDSWISTDKGVSWTQQSTTGSPSGYRGSIINTRASSTSSFVTIAAAYGDVYNIGGVSGDPTNHIEFTMWANSAYGSRGQGE